MSKPMDVNKQSIEMFLNQAFQKVLKELSRKQIRLKESIISCLELLKKPGVLQIENYLGNKNKLVEFESILNKIVATFKLICETKQPKIVIVAVDCFQKMINYGCFASSPVDIEDKDKKLIDKLIEVISNTYEIADDNIQLQIVKVMLTIVTSNQCEVHDNALMSAIRCCFNVHLISKNNINLSTAKGTLTQMVNTVFQRHQKFYEDFEQEQAILKAQKEEELNNESNNGVSNGNGDSNHVTDSNEKVDDSKDEEKQNNGEDKSQIEIIEVVEEKKEEEIEEKSMEEVKLTSEEIAKEIIYNIVNSIPQLNTVNEIKEEKNNEVKKEEIKKEEIKVEVKEEIKKEEPKVVEKDKLTIISENLQRAYNDCSLIFVALCKLSTKEVPPSLGVDSVDMRRKLLSLELLQMVVDNTGSSLKTNELFIDQSIKKHLFFSILTNGVSLFPRVFRLSLNIFQALVTNFKDFLKNEIGIFFSKILLRVLSSSNSAIHQKNSVLRLLLNICKNAQTLVDIFLNYDCHLESEDLFESMVNYISGIAKGSSNPLANQQESETYLLALECLVTIMRSQVNWSAELADDVNHNNDQPKDENQSNNLLQNQNSNSSNNVSGNNNHNNIDENNIDSFAKIKQKKQRLEYGKKLFNYKPKKGIQYLIEAGILENNTKVVAKFLLTEEGLDRTIIGHYIGEIKDKFCLGVLYDYVDLQDFEGLAVDMAIRKFFEGFRLLGEAQVVDKIMEKFAEKYYNDNAKEGEDFIFLNADATYVFAFHIIMLTTDLHNPANRNKMTKSEWVKNNRGLNDSKDFPEQFLSDIYDRIAAKAIKTRDDTVTPSPSTPQQDLLNPRQKRLLFHKESKLVIKKSQEEIIEKLRQKSSFFKSSNIEHVKPMFERCWCPMLAAFSVVLETTDGNNKQVISLCLEGFKCAIRVSSIFFLETERNAFVTSLSQFTLLSNTREMKQKNIDAIKCLIQIANEDGNYLQDSWTQVLNCISQLSKIHLLGSGVKTIADFALSPAEERAQRRISFEHQNKQPSSIAANGVNNSAGSVAPSPLVNIINIKRHDKLYEGVNASSVVDQIDVNEIDKIFTNTTLLNSNAIVEFVKTLCNISEIEVNSPEPRTFSLQKLVEIAYFNMERIRFVWSRIWVIMATHFVKIACHKNLKVAMYAVDSVRQLAIKFLEKDELANYHFQKDFLKPFELIITNNSSLQIRELVVRCVSQIILSKSQNIKSGWKSMLSVFTFAASDSSELIASLAFEMVEKIIKEHFQLIGDTFFVEFINCLVAYGKSNHYKENSLRALEAIEVAAMQLAEGKISFNVLFPSSLPPPKNNISNNNININNDTDGENKENKEENKEETKNEIEENSTENSTETTEKENKKEEKLSEKSSEERTEEETLSESETEKTLLYSSDIQFNDGEIHLKYWFPILTGLSRVISHNHVDVRTSALDKLFTILTKCGNLFTAKLWELIFRGVLLPIFDNVNYASDSFLLHSDNEWLVTTCLKALSYFVELFSFYFEKIQFLLLDFLALLTKCILQENENLAMIGCSCFLHFIISNGKNWNEKIWFVVTTTIRYIVKQNCCVELLSIGEKSAQSLRHQRTNSVDIKDEQQGGIASGDSNPSLSSSSDINLNENSSSDHSNENNNNINKYQNNNNESEENNKENSNEENEMKIFVGIEEISIEEIEQKLKQSTPPKIRPFDVKVIIGKCTVQIELVNSIKDIATNHFDSLENDHFVILFDSLLHVYNFASKVNHKKQIWRATSKTGIMGLILQQESSSMNLYLSLLFKIYQQNVEDKDALVESRMLSIVEKLIREYIEEEKNLSTPPNYLTSKVPIILDILNGLLQLSDQKFLKHLNNFYVLYVELTTANNQEIRNLVKGILLHIGKLHNFLSIAN